MLREHTGTGIHTEISGKNNGSHIFNKVNAVAKVESVACIAKVPFNTFKLLATGV